MIVIGIRVHGQNVNKDSSLRDRTGCGPISTAPGLVSLLISSAQACLCHPDFSGFRRPDLKNGINSGVHVSMTSGVICSASVLHVISVVSPREVSFRHDRPEGPKDTGPTDMR